MNKILINFPGHDFVPDAKRRMQKIQAALSRTHNLTYQYPFVWENWRIKE